MTVDIHFNGNPEQVRHEMAQMLGVGLAVVAVADLTKMAGAPATTKAADKMSALATQEAAARIAEKVEALKAEKLASTRGKKKAAEPEDDNEARPVSLADIRPALKVLYALAGEKSDKDTDEGKATDSAEAVFKVLNAFGVKKVSDLAEEQYGDVFAAIKTATAALEG